MWHLWKKCILCNLQQSLLALGDLSYNSNGTCIRYNCLLTDSFKQMNVNISLVVGIGWAWFERVKLVKTKQICVGVNNSVRQTVYPMNKFVCHFLVFREKSFYILDYLLQKQHICTKIAGNIFEIFSQIFLFR